MEPSNRNKAILRDLHHIDLYLYGYFNKDDVIKARLYEDNKFLGFLNLESFSVSESSHRCIVTFSFKHKILAGKDYRLFDCLNRAYSVDVTYIASLDEFEKKYRYDGPLGALYSKEKTEFRIFSPLSTKMFCEVFNSNESHLVNLKRNDKGVFIGSIDGDYEGYKYLLYAKINGNVVQTCDPYAKSVDTNSQFGYIVDTSKIQNIETYSSNIRKNSKLNSIIYELDVRDMTSKLNVVDKGTFKCLSTSNLKYKNMPVGIDYLKSLEVSHVQIMPVFDFQTITDDFKNDSYNWGYDPKFYFAIEGSYSTNSEDPYLRMSEFKNMVSTFHKNGMKVNMDVVFNHVFDSETNPLNRLLPNYCYRRNQDGSLSNATGCGNELDTQKYMIRKLILDNVKYFKDVYGIDGFRFDLMGLLDIETIKQVRKLVDSYKNNDLVYGEGWDMNSTLDGRQRSSLYNSSRLLGVGFFNDRFRDICRGRNQFNNLSICGYLNGDLNYIDGFKHVFSGSITSIAFPPLFKQASQSINYVECHDDNCLYDKLSCTTSNDDVILQRINLINACILFSNGISFIHAGQEFGQSKSMIRNSYNAGDNINGFDYEVANSRIDMIEYFKDAIQVKEKYFSTYTFDTLEKMKDNIEFIDLPNKSLLVKYKKNKQEKMLVFINPTNDVVTYDLDFKCTQIFSKKGKCNVSLKKEVEVEPISISVLIRG